MSYKQYYFNGPCNISSGDESIIIFNKYVWIYSAVQKRVVYAICSYIYYCQLMRQGYEFK